MNNNTESEAKVHPDIPEEMQKYFVPGSGPLMQQPKEYYKYSMHRLNEVPQVIASKFPILGYINKGHPTKAGMKLIQAALAEIFEGGNRVVKMALQYTMHDNTQTFVIHYRNEEEGDEKDEEAVHPVLES